MIVRRHFLFFFKMHAKLQGMAEKHGQSDFNSLASYRDGLVKKPPGFFPGQIIIHANIGDVFPQNGICWKRVKLTVEVIQFCLKAAPKEFTCCAGLKT